MLSAQGAVQQYSYQATAPLLLNTGGQPTYFMALKDASQLVKMYAMVNVSQYDAVAIGSNVEECVDNYVELLAERGIGVDTPVAPPSGEDVSGVVAEVRYAVVEGQHALLYPPRGLGRVLHDKRRGRARGRAAQRGRQRDRNALRRGRRPPAVRSALTIDSPRRSGGARRNRTG